MRPTTNTAREPLLLTLRLDAERARDNLEQRRKLGYPR
jgi:hypothetical protein